MKQFITSTLCFLLMGLFTKAQNITGKVFDETNTPLANVTATLQNAKDSTIVKISVTDKQGFYSFMCNNGNYFITYSSVGFAKTKSATIELNNNYEVPNVVLKKATKNLGEVTVSSKKPMIEVKADKTIFNVESSINAVGTDAFELLRKSPGIMIDREDNISMNGKNGVLIYIDGRPSPLTQKDLANYLKSMQSNNIEAIELITNPSAKYDAAGNAGIINIRLKKNKSFGANGSVNAGYAIGTYSKYAMGTNLNYRNKKVNLFGSYNFNKSLNTNTIDIYRDITDSIFDSKGTMNNHNTNHSFKAGMDFYANKKSTFGIMINGNFTDGNTDNFSNTDIFAKNIPVKYRTLVANNTANIYNNNVNYNGNYRYVDTSGKELNVDLNYGTFRINSNQRQPNQYFDATGLNFLDRNYQMISPSNIDIANAKIDYEQKLWGGKIETGVKVSNVKTDNDFQRFDGIFGKDPSPQKDDLRSNAFSYKENVNAAYVNFNKQYNSGIMIQVGLRVENTNIIGESKGKRDNGSGNLVSFDSTIKRDYTNLFPSAAITFNKNPMSQWSLTYSRRIDRPAYQDLNPFEFKLDEYQYQRGNTNLTPQYTNSFGISHTYKYMLTTQLNYSRVTDVFAQLIERADESKAFITKKNLATQDVISLNISYPIQKGKYNAYFNVSGNYSHYKANFGEGKVVDLDAVAANFYMQHGYNLGKGFNAELSSWFSTPSIQEGTFKSKSMGFVDIGVSKQIMQGNGTIKIAVSDIFRTMRWAGESKFDGQRLNASSRWESQQFKVNFNYRFGKATVKAARRRETGAEDESKRVKSGGGGLGGN